MESWKKHNTEYTITLLTKKNFMSWVNIPKEISSHPNFEQRFAELICVYALTEHGGIWIDSSVLLKEPVDKWLFPRYAECSGFYLSRDKDDKEQPPILVNWFLACNKDSPFMKLLRDEFLQITNYKTIQAYLESRSDFTKDIPTPIDNVLLVAAQKVFQVDNYPLDRFILKKAEDGPIKYLVDAKWDSEKGLRLACSNQKYQNPIMKMRSAERNILEEHIGHDLSSEICGWLN